MEKTVTKYSFSPIFPIFQEVSAPQCPLKQSAHRTHRGNGNFCHSLTLTATAARADAWYVLLRRESSGRGWGDALGRCSPGGIVVGDGMSASRSTGAYIGLAQGRGDRCVQRHWGLGHTCGGQLGIKQVVALMPRTVQSEVLGPITVGDRGLRNIAHGLSCDDICDLQTSDWRCKRSRCRGCTIARCAQAMGGAFERT